MRHPRFRLPGRLAIAAIVAPLLLLLAAVEAEAKDAVTLTVHAGYQDVIKPGNWMPVTVDARNAGAAVDGTLEIQESLNAQPGVSGLALYHQPISLAAGATKRVRAYVEIDTTGATVTARIVVNGRVIASQDSVAAGTTTALIGVLADQATTLDDFAAIHPASIAARVVHLKPDELPDSAVALGAFDILAINDFATDGLTAGQRTAMADYVSLGGNLLIGTGAAWHKTLAGIPATLLPMQITGTRVVDTTARGAAAVELASGNLTDGRVWLADGNEPLIAERSIGLGTVSLATFDWNQQPVAISSDSRGVLRQVMARAMFAYSGQGLNQLYGIGGGGAGPAPFGFGGSRVSVSSKSGALTSVLGNLPGLDLPSLQLTGLLVLLYVLVVGPINYVVLGALHRRALAWITVPLIAIVASAGAYGAGVFTKGRSVQANQVAIIHVQPGTNRAYQEIYTGIIPPSRGEYQIGVSGDGLLISPIANTSNGYSASGLRVNVRTNEVTLSGMTAFALGGFATENLAAAPRLSAHLKLVGGKLVATIENHSGMTFSDGVVIAGDGFQTFGVLNPGATVTVSVTPKFGSSAGNPLYTRIYGNTVYPGGYGPGAPEDSSSGRATYAKSQILSLLTVGGGLKGAASSTGPMVVAWSHDPVQSLNVNGSHPRSTATSAVAFSLPVDQLGTGTLPVGIVNSRIVDVVGDSQGNGPPGMLLLQNGTVTYEFSPALAPGTRLTGVSVTSSNPYGVKFVGPNGPSGSTGTPGIEAQVWDWSQSDWTDVAYQDNGTTALPDSAVNPTTGAVRMRVSATNGGFLASTLGLSGTIR
jgi:hypothetical protein